MDSKCSEVFSEVLGCSESFQFILSHSHGF